MLIGLRWLADDDSEEDVEDEPATVTNPIVFSEDPVACSNEMLEFANDLVDIAVTNITESEGIMDAFQIEELSWWKERQERFGLLAIPDYWLYLSGKIGSN
jgi:hypothetical protein